MKPNVPKHGSRDLTSFGSKVYSWTLPLNTVICNSLPYTADDRVDTSKARDYGLHKILARGQLGFWDCALTADYESLLEGKESEQMQRGRPGRTTIAEVDRVSTVIHIPKIAVWLRENSNLDVTSLWPAALADLCATDMTDRLRAVWLPCSEAQSLHEHGWWQFIKCQQDLLAMPQISPLEPLFFNWWIPQLDNSAIPIDLCGRVRPWSYVSEGSTHVVCCKLLLIIQCIKTSTFDIYITLSLKPSSIHCIFNPQIYSIWLRKAINSFTS